MEHSNVYVKYCEDGSLSIKGKSDCQSWYELSDFCLDKDDYYIGGLSDVERNTNSLVIEFYDLDSDWYIQMVKDIGPYSYRKFKLETRTNIKEYVKVYPSCDCNVIARPVIYKLEEQK